jgi:hypothetical protein
MSLLEDVLTIINEATPETLQWLRELLSAEHARLLRSLKDRLGDRTIQPEPGDDKGWAMVGGAEKHEPPSNQKPLPNVR